MNGDGASIYTCDGTYLNSYALPSVALQQFDSDPARHPRAICHDGTYVYTLNSEGSVRKFDKATMTLVDSSPAMPAGTITEYQQIILASGMLYFTAHDGKVRRLDPDNFAGGYTVLDLAHQLEGVAYTAGNLYVTDFDGGITIVDTDTFTIVSRTDFSATYLPTRIIAA